MKSLNLFQFSFINKVISGFKERSLLSPSRKTQPLQALFCFPEMKCSLCYAQQILFAYCQGKMFTLDCILSIFLMAIILGFCFLFFFFPSFPLLLPIQFSRRCYLITLQNKQRRVYFRVTPYTCSHHHLSYTSHNQKQGELSSSLGSGMACGDCRDSKPSSSYKSCVTLGKFFNF